MRLDAAAVYEPASRVEAGTRPEQLRPIAYRCVVDRLRTSNARRAVASIAFVLAIGLIGGACGGASDSSDDVAIDDTRPTTTVMPSATAAAVVIPTSTPLPTVTPPPTLTPVPLEAPTPSTVLLTTAFTNSSKVTTVGIDEVFFGMTPEEAAEAASTTWVGEPADDSTCYLVTPATGPEGVTLWVVDGRIERVDIEHPDIRTPSALGLGNTEDELQSQLGDRVAFETRGDGGTNATFTPADPGDREFRIVFELVDDKVVRYRSGRVSVIDRAVAGC